MDTDPIRKAYQALIATRQSVILATANATHEAEASYAPYIEEAGIYFIYVSGLAAHTANLLTTGRASLLFVEDEASCHNMFARQRVTLACTAHEVARETPAFDARLDAFAARFGNIISMVRGLRDFRLLALTPEHGICVAGFGKAYTLHGPGLSLVELRRG